MALRIINLDTAADEEPYENPLARIMAARPASPDTHKDVVRTSNGNIVERQAR